MKAAFLPFIQPVKTRDPDLEGFKDFFKAWSNLSSAVQLKIFRKQLDSAKDLTGHKQAIEDWQAMMNSNSYLSQLSQQPILQPAAAIPNGFYPTSASPQLRNGPARSLQHGALSMDPFQKGPNILKPEPNLSSSLPTAGSHKVNKKRKKMGRPIKSKRDTPSDTRTMALFYESNPPQVDRQLQSTLLRYSTNKETHFLPTEGNLITYMADNHQKQLQDKVQELGTGSLHDGPDNRATEASEEPRWVPVCVRGRLRGPPVEYLVEWKYHDAAEWISKENMGNPEEGMEILEELWSIQVNKANGSGGFIREPQEERVTRDAYVAAIAPKSTAEGIAGSHAARQRSANPGEPVHFNGRGGNSNVI
ncbi:hypothetical protein BJ875DRAFT_483279 [Amylocarpus encephaloides]|uniref:Chromo domain-containing protein n=1 Tax=Amylocarpus encephaloides TaxID=45428 RepID=A0A9P7YLU7_9HELO|nr:hypothetical protein BJ875DRAFT_483279 [Amylocarpus encephaloides]